LRSDLASGPEFYLLEARRLWLLFYLYDDEDSSPFLSFAKFLDWSV